MELDKRIKDINTIQTILKYDVNHIGCKGYFFDMLWQIEDLSKCCYGKLVDIDEDSEDQLFKSINGKGNINFFRFFISENDLKPIEKKYRPYTMNEFKAEFKIGMVLTLRNRDTPDYVYQVMYLGNRQYDEYDSNNNIIFLSQRFFSLRELFNMFEIVRNGEWQPFGVLDE